MPQLHNSQSNLQLFLDRLTSRSVLTSEEQHAILNLPSHVAQIETNRDFVGPGERVDHACLVVAGLVGRFGQNSEGQRQITALHIPGDLPDLHSIVQPNGSIALQALSVATIFRIPHSAIREVAARYPAVSEALWRDCMVDAAILAEWVVNVGRRDAKSRLAHLFCEMATRLEAVDGCSRFQFTLAITQAQLADATGMTPVHVNRTIMALRKSGLAEMRGSRFYILDWHGLVAAGDFDEDYLQRRAPRDRLRMAPVAL